MSSYEQFTIHFAMIPAVILNGVESQIFALSSQGYEFSPFISDVVLMLSQVILILN